MQKAKEKNWIQIDFYFSRLKVNREIHHLSRTGFTPGIKDSNHVEKSFYGEYMELWTSRYC